MTEITINLDHGGRTYLVRITARLADDEAIFALAEEIQTRIVKGLQDEQPNFDGPVPSVAFANWISGRLVSVTTISSIIVGVVGRISVILRDDSPHRPATIVAGPSSLNIH